MTLRQGPGVPRSARDSVSTMWVPVVCALVGAIVFTPAIGAGRLADDFVLLRTVRGVTSVFWPFAHNDLGQASGAGHFYRPLWVLWNSGVYAISHGPAFAHVTNLGLFALICVEVAVLLRRLVGTRGALAGGLFFAVFPSHGESVAWISGNTDLLAVTIGLAAVLMVITDRPTAARTVFAVVLTGAAVLAKEVAVVIPVLTALLLGDIHPGTDPAASRRRWWPIAGMVGAALVVLIARSFVVHGLGGYGTSSVSVRRAVGSLVSFSVAALSAPQLEVLHHPLLLAVPLLLAALGAWGIYRAHRAGQRWLVMLALKGCAWFLIALLPVLNQPLNLNTSNGDRLLLLPSVGFAITVAALMTVAVGRRALVAWLALVVAFAVSCLADANDWRVAGQESNRLLTQIVHLAPPSSHLVMLSFPTDYRAAHLFPDALQEAVQQSGRPTVTVTTCAPVQALELRPNQVVFRRLFRGNWLGTTTENVPFNKSVFGGGVTSGSVDCTAAAGPSNAFSVLGTTSEVIVHPPAGVRPAARLAYFDGLDVRGLN